MGTTVCQWSYKDLNLSAQGKSVNAAFTFCRTREGENSFLVSSFQVYEMPRMTSYTKSWRSLQLRISTNCVVFRCLRRLVKTNINPKCMLKLKKHEYNYYTICYRPFYDLIGVSDCLYVGFTLFYIKGEKKRDLLPGFSHGSIRHWYWSGL